MISMARTRVQTGREPEWSVGTESVSSDIILISSIRKTSASVFSSNENCFRSKNTTRVHRSVKGKTGLSDNDLSSIGQRWCLRSIKSCSCYSVVKNKWHTRQWHTYLSEQFVIIRKDALDKLERERLVQILEIEKVGFLRVSE